MLRQRIGVALLQTVKTSLSHGQAGEAPASVRHMVSNDGPLHTSRISNHEGSSQKIKTFQTLSMLFIESPPAAQNKSQLEERIAAPESKRMWPQVQAAMMNARPPTSVKQDLQVKDKGKSIEKAA